MGVNCKLRQKSKGTKSYRSFLSSQVERELKTNYFHYPRKDVVKLNNVPSKLFNLLFKPSKQNKTFHKFLRKIAFN